MLRQRLLTAAVLIPLVIWGILGLPSPWFALLLALFVLLGAWEWAALAPFVAPWQRAAYTALIALLGASLWPLLGEAAARLVILPASALVWWAVCLIWVARFPHTSAVQRSPWGKAVAGLWVLLPAWVALAALHGQAAFGPQYVLYLLVLIWVADSAAYFTGRRWGRRKLAPAVSPGKTWEGCWGALAGAGLWALGALLWLPLAGERPLAFIGLSLVVVMFSILGDLVESLFKRQAGVKDSGTLFPGHGGVLDRIDSLTAAAPAFFTGLWLLAGPA